MINERERIVTSNYTAVKSSPDGHGRNGRTNSIRFYEHIDEDTTAVLSHREVLMPWASSGPIITYYAKHYCNSWRADGEGA